MCLLSLVTALFPTPHSSLAATANSTAPPALGELDHAWPTGTLAAVPSSACKLRAHSVTPHIAPGSKPRCISSVEALTDRIPTAPLWSSTRQAISTARLTEAVVEAVRQAAALFTS